MALNRQGVGITAQPPQVRQGSQPSTRRQFRPDGTPIARPMPGMEMRPQGMNPNAMPQQQMPMARPTVDPRQVALQQKLNSGQGDPNRIAARQEWMNRHPQQQQSQQQQPQQQGNPQPWNQAQGMGQPMQYPNFGGYQPGFGNGPMPFQPGQWPGLQEQASRPAQDSWKGMPMNPQNYYYK